LKESGIERSRDRRRKAPYPVLREHPAQKRWFSSEVKQDEPLSPSGSKCIPSVGNTNTAMIDRPLCSQDKSPTVVLSVYGELDSGKGRNLRSEYGEYDISRL
jgi:hypothetical protein